MTSVDYGTYLFFIMLVYFVWHYIFRKAIIELYRGKMYQIRSELFFFACDGVIEFDSKQYRLAEVMINSAIQKAETVSLIRFFVFEKLLLKFRIKYLTEIQEKTSNLNEVVNQEFNFSEAQQIPQIQVIMKKADLYSGAYMVATNPLMLIIALVYLSYLLFIAEAKKPKDIIGKLGHTINWEANNQFAV